MPGKAITFSISNYDLSTTPDDTSTTLSPTSYLVIGGARGADDDPPAALRGDELVSGLAFKDDLRDTVYADSADVQKSYYTDDGATKTTYTASDRSTITDSLLTRGGWRDHTDGNRISTTRGDCVDVVYGNYKLVVLGRITQSFDPSDNGGLGDAGNTDTNTTLTHNFFDASGGHITEGTSIGGQIVSCIWQSTDQGGCWESVQQTDSGDKKVYYTGRYEREIYGSKLETTVGKGTDAISIDNGNNTAVAHSAEKPDVTETTYARAITHTESMDKRTLALKISGDVEDETRVHNSFLKAAVYKSYVENISTVGFREELMAHKVSRYAYVSKERAVTDVGVVSARAAAIGYHETAVSGSNFNFWILGMEGTFKTPLSFGLTLGMDSAYGMCPCVDTFMGAATVRVHLTLDGMACLWWLRTKIVKKKLTVAQMNLNSTVVNNSGVQWVV